MFVKGLFGLLLLFVKGQNKGEEIKLYLQKLKLKKIPERFKEMLNAEVSTEEMYETIATTKIGKAPGPNGLAAIF